MLITLSQNQWRAGTTRKQTEEERRQEIQRRLFNQTGKILDRSGLFRLNASLKNRIYTYNSQYFSWTDAVKVNLKYPKDSWPTSRKSQENLLNTIIPELISDIKIKHNLDVYLNRWDAERSYGSDKNITIKFYQTEED